MRQEVQVFQLVEVAGGAIGSGLPADLDPVGRGKGCQIDVFEHVVLDEVGQGELAFAENDHVDFGKELQSRRGRLGAERGSPHGHGEPRVALLELADEVEAGRELAEHAGETEQAEFVPVRGGDPILGDRLHPRGEAGEVHAAQFGVAGGLPAEEPGDRLGPVGVEQGREHAFGQPGPFRDRVILLVADGFGDAQVNVVGGDLDGRKAGADKGFQGADLDRRPGVERPRGRDEGDTIGVRGSVRFHDGRAGLRSRRG